MSEQAYLSLQDISKSYAAKAPLAVDQISMDIANGELVTLLGPSGSGKTTLLNMISGFLQPDQGQIRVAGRDITHLPPHKRDIGVVFQNYALFPHMNVAQNVAFPLKQRKIGKTERNRQVHDILDLVGLADKAGAKPGQLSGGQQQRVAFARALVFAPDLLLLDEPLGALDKALRGKLQAEIRRLHKVVGKTFVFVTHDQEEALALSDRIAVINHGRLEQFAAAHDVYERPATLFCASFLGQSTIIRGTRRGNVMISPVGNLDLHDALPALTGDVALVIRPEHVTLGDADDTATDGHSLVATVIDVIYQGSSRRLQIALADGTTGVVMETAGHYSRAQAGDRVCFRWHTEKTWLVPQTTAPTA